MRKTPENSVVADLHPVRWGLLLGLLTLALGLGLGIVQGLFEDSIQEEFRSLATQTEISADAQSTNRLVGKCWNYVKRSHLHANGLGTSALALLTILAFVPASAAWKRLTAITLGSGAFSYSLFWLLAAYSSAALGNTGAGKESLRWLAIPSAGACVLGFVAGAWLICHALFSRHRNSAED